jgi:hypothetical protein
MQRQALREDLFSGRTSVDALRKQGMTDEQIRELVSGKRWLPGEQPFEYEGPKLTIKTSQEPDLEALKRAAEIRKRQLEVERESARALEEARRRGLTRVGSARQPLLWRLLKSWRRRIESTSCLWTWTHKPTRP